MSLDLLFNIIGTAGVVLIILAYFMVQIEKIRSDQLSYSVLNLVGAILLLISLFWAWNTPSVIIECCWIAISLYGIFKVIKKRRQSDAKQT